MNVRVSVVLRRTVCDDLDWRFDNLSESPDDFRSGGRKASVNVITNCPSQDYIRSDDHTFTDLDFLVQTVYIFYLEGNSTVFHSDNFWSAVFQCNPL